MPLRLGSELAQSIRLGYGMRDLRSLLFSNGRTGAWYDLPDASTVYQDSAGTTAGVIGNPVGLRLDKSLGAGLGPDVVANGSFAADLSGWTVVGGAVWSGGVASLPTASTSSIEQAVETIPGRAYRVTCTIGGTGSFCGAWDNSGTTNALPMLGGGSSPANRNGSTGFTFVANDTQSFLYFIANAGGAGSVDNVTCRALPAGNHATQANSTSRPLWKQDANGFLHEEFDGADDYLTSATGGGGNAGFFYCGAIYVGGGAGTLRTIWSDRTGVFGYQVRVNASNQLEMVAGNGTVSTFMATPATLPVGETHVITAWDDGTSLNLQVDQGAVSSVARPAVAAGTTSFTEGRDNGASSNHFPGRIYSRVYRKDSAPDAATRELVKRRIAAKAGISL